MRKVLVIVAAVSLILLAACASVPQEQINAAKAAMDKAKAAGAEMYAPESLKAVTDKEAALNAELADQEGSLFKSYDLTSTLTAEMLDLATKAEADAVAGKEKAKTEANDVVTAAEAAVTAAREALTKAPKGKGSAADLAAMTGDVDAAAKTIEEAKADVTAEKYFDAKTKAETAKAQAEKVTADIQAAIDLKKGKK
jgi:hypothetical protein